MSEDPRDAETSPSEMTIVCSHCGAETPLSSTSCISCETPLETVDPQWTLADNDSTSGGWSRALAGVGCAILVLVAAVAAFFVGCAILFSRF